MSQKAFIGVWRKWYAEKAGLPEKSIMINGRHGKAAKELIAHITEAHPETEPTEVLKAILNNWDRLESFYQKNFMELWSIANHWNNLVNKIKNEGTSEYEQALSKLRNRA